MGGGYRVVHFVEDDGSDPIEEFLDSVKRDPKQWAIVNDGITRLSNVGLQLCQTNAAKEFDIRNKLFELTKGNYRVVFHANNYLFTLLHGFEKHSKKTLRSDKTIVYDRLEKITGEKRK